MNLLVQHILALHLVALVRA